MSEHEAEDVLVDYEADEDEDHEINNEHREKDPIAPVADSSAGDDVTRYNESVGTKQKRKFQSEELEPVQELDETDPHKRHKRDDEGNGVANGIPFAKRGIGLERPLMAKRDTVEVVKRDTVVKSGNSAYGVYIPPFRRRQLEKEAENAEAKAEDETVQPVLVPPMHVQRQKWEDLKKAINGTINRLNTRTIKELIHGLFKNANLLRGKGLLAKAVLRAATTSPAYCPVYASLIAVINTKLPEIGELIVVRAILMFRRSYARQDRGITMAITNFLGCLFNQGLCHELLCLQLLTIMLEGDPTDDSVEVAVQFTKVVGMALMESSPAGIHAIMERFRNLLHDGRIGRRVQYKIEELMKIRKDSFKAFPALDEELDLVEKEEQITFEIYLDDEGLEKDDKLDIFHFDPNWVENENDWVEIKREILGEDSDDEDGSSSEEEEGSETDDSDDDDEDGVLPEAAPSHAATNKQVTEIHDMSETDLINLRRTIYLTIMSSATFEECSHKLSKLDVPMGKEMELINMLIECCSQERTFLRYYGLIAARFCLMHRRWSGGFHEAFIAQYETIHRLETNKLRNVAKLFAHLLHTDSLSWSCLSIIHLNEDETTSSSRIFLKILVQEMAEAMGIGTLVKRFETDDPETMEWFKEMFPKDNPRKTRYAINFFTSIGLGPLTDGLREYLKNAPKLIMMQAKEEAERLKALENGSDSDESSSVVSSSTSSSSSVSSSSVSSSSYSSYSSRSYSSRSSDYSSDESSYRRRRRRGRSRRRKSRKSRGRSYSSDSSRSVSPSPSERKRSKKSRSRSSSHSRARNSEGGNQEIREKRRSRSESLDSLGRAKKNTNQKAEDERSRDEKRASSSRPSRDSKKRKSDSKRSRQRSRSYSRSLSPSSGSRSPTHKRND